MKILKILYSEDEGGVLQAESQYMHELSKTGVEIFSIIVGKGRNLRTYEKLSNTSIHVATTDLNIIGSNIQKLKSLIGLLCWSKKTYNELPMQLKKQKFDAICFGRVSFAFLAWYISNSSKSRVFYFIHNSFNSLKSVYSHKFIFNILNIIPIANSKYTNKTFENGCEYILYPGYDENRIGGLNIKSNYRDEFQIKDDTLVLGIAARICAFKAQDLIVSILLSEEFKNENFVLLLAGKLQDEKVLDKIKSIAGDRFGCSVIYMGELTSIDKFYSSIDVLINSGLGPESFGMSVVEALASGVPVVASSIGGTAETVIDGYNGWLFNEFNISSYRNILLRVFNDRHRLKEFSNNATNSVEEFNLKNNIRKLVQIIKIENKS